MVDPLYSIEKLCRTLQGLTARFYSGALCYQRLVDRFITIEWRSQPPRVVARGIQYIYIYTESWKASYTPSQAQALPISPTWRCSIRAQLTDRAFGSKRMRKGGIGVLVVKSCQANTVCHVRGKLFPAFDWESCIRISLGSSWHVILVACSVASWWLVGCFTLAAEMLSGDLKQSRLKNCEELGTVQLGRKYIRRTSSFRRYARAVVLCSLLVHIKRS